MHFRIVPGAGPSRTAVTLRFLDDHGVAWSLDAGPGGVSVESREGGEVDGLRDLDQAAYWVAKALKVCADTSLVVCSGRTLHTPNEPESADVYPPHRHPQINVER